MDQQQHNSTPNNTIINEDNVVHDDEFNNGYQDGEGDEFNNGEEDDEDNQLYNAILSNEINVVKEFIEQHGYDQFEAMFGFAIVRNCSTDMIDYILTLSPSLLMKQDDNGCTPLLFTCQMGHVELFQHLITKYNTTINPYTLSTENHNIMHYAVESNNPAMVKAVVEFLRTTPPNEELLNAEKNENEEYNLPPSLPTGYPYIVGEWVEDAASPLYIAARTMKLDSFKQLIRSKADLTLSVSDEWGDFQSIIQYVYFYAHEDKNYSIFEYLLSDEFISDWNSNEIQFQDEIIDDMYNEKNPIQLQIEMEEEEIAYTPLLQAICNKDLTAMKLLLKRGANLLATDTYYQNVFHLLFMYGSNDTTHVLNIIDYITSFPIINARELLSQTPAFGGHTPLLSAVDLFPFPIVQKLIELNSPLHVIDSKEQSLLHIAASNTTHTLIADLLQHYGNELQQQLYLYDQKGLLPFHCAITKMKSNLNVDVQGDNNNTNNNDTDVQNPDIEVFIEKSPQLLFQKTKSNGTILHIAVGSTKVELSTRVAGLIEAVIDHFDEMVL